MNSCQMWLSWSVIWCEQKFPPDPRAMVKQDCYRWAFPNTIEYHARVIQVARLWFSLHSNFISASSRAGDVEVTVLDQTGNRLGMTTFRYVDHEREMLKQLVNNKEKQCLFFSMWAQECALGKFGNYNTAQGGDLVTLQDQGKKKLNLFWNGPET